MLQRKWYFKNGSHFELYNVLYDNGINMLVQNADTGHYSFGPCSCFGSLYGFPVDNSCLTVEELLSRLNDYIDIDSKPEYACLTAYQKQEWGFTAIEQWQAMKNAIL